MTRSYKAKHLSDALRQAHSDAAQGGLVVQSYAWQEGRSGCLRFLLLGPLAFFVRPKGELTVVLASSPVEA